MGLSKDRGVFENESISIFEKSKQTKNRVYKPRIGAAEKKKW